LPAGLKFALLDVLKSEFMKKVEKEKLWALSIDEKIEYSIRIIREALNRFSNDALYIAWTGGKDSTTTLWLYKEVCQKLGCLVPKAIFIDDGFVFKETLDLMDRVKTLWNVQVVILKNADILEKIEKAGDPVQVSTLNNKNRQEISGLGYDKPSFKLEPESLIGTHLLKTVPLKVFLETYDVLALSTGIRWDEHRAREDEDFFSPRNDPDYIRVHPILHLKEADIWRIINANNIPFCDLYAQGYRSLGAKNTTTKTSNTQAWEQDKNGPSERAGRDQTKEDIIARLRALGYM
jgi:phosphoadenosine phosphosulfate reductase